MFNQARGMNYMRFFRRLHESHVFDWYLEIGCRGGRILSLSRGKTIGVDPVFRLQTDVLGSKPVLHLFQEESDAFFRKNSLKALKAKLSVTFIDGMHLFEYALRDFMNTEANSDSNGVILLHDCYPFSHEMTTRDLTKLPKIWTGDVWKMVPILKEYRPDLELVALDAAPTGLLLVKNLRPDSKKLAEAYDNIVEQYRDVTLEDYGTESFFDLLEYTSARAVARGGFDLLGDVPRAQNRASFVDVVTP